MGSIGGLLGLAGGAGGTGFAGPQGTNIVPGTNAGQIQTAYGGAQNSLQSQQALLEALQRQQGLGNQSQVYNQLQGVVAGTGPNPAEAMLNQATGQNVANQAALMASQRGAGANAGLIARQAAQQGAGIQQNAVGQAATMQAQQSLNALGAAGNMASQQAGQQIGQVNQNTQAQMAQQQLLQNALANQNQSNVSMQSNINQQNAGLAQTQMQGTQKIIGGLMNMAGGGAGAAGKASGGMISGHANTAGNSNANDTVAAKLSPGELVVDRETMADPGIAGNAARLLAALIEAKNKGVNSGNKLARGGFAENPELKESTVSSWEDLKNNLSQAGSQESFDQSMSSLPKSPGEAIAQEMTGGQPINQAPVAPEIQTDRVPATQAAPVPQPQGAPVPQAMPATQPELGNTTQVAAPPQTGLAPKQAQGVQPAPSAPPEQTETPAAQPAAATPQAPQVQMGPKTYEQHVQETKTDLDQKSKAWAQDLANGHITPKTYSSMFAEQSTLGKIGMIFGMLMSGAGSALAGQQNAFISAMDKTINDDLEAQKLSKGNAINYLKMDQEKKMATAQIEQMKLQGKLTEAQAKHALAETDTKQYAIAKMRMNEAALHKLTLDVQKYPVGSPDRMKAEQTLGMLYNTVQAENFNIMDKAASASAYHKMMFGTGEGGAGQPGAEEQQFQKQTAALRAMGPQGEARAKDMESKHLPGLPGQASIPLTPEDRTRIGAGVQFDQQLGRFIEWTKKHSGAVDPKVIDAGKALAAELQGAYRQASNGGVYKEGEQHFINTLIDSDPTKFFNEIRVLPKLNAIAEEHNAKMNQMLKSVGFQGYQGQHAQTQAQAEQPETQKMNGKQYIKRGNYMVPVGS